MGRARPEVQLRSNRAAKDEKTSGLTFTLDLDLHPLAPVALGSQPLDLRGSEDPLSVV